MRRFVLAPLLTTLLACAAAQPAPAGERVLVLEVGSVHDSISFTEAWWGETDPLYWISTDGSPHTLLRFAGVEVPRGATIESAVVTVWSYNAAAADPADHVTVWLEPTDDAAPLADPAEAWERKDLGGTRVRWATTTPGRGEPQPSPDLAELVQAIVDRPGWASGNALRFFVAPGASPAHDGRQVHSYYTGAPNATRPRLEIRFRPGPP